MSVTHPSYLGRIRKAIERAGLFGGTSSDRLRDRIFTGIISLGPVVIYGANAMHYAVNVRTSRGYICARPTTTQYRRWAWYLYVSPDATPQRAWWGIGPGFTVPDAVQRAERDIPS